MRRRALPAALLTISMILLTLGSGCQGAANPKAAFSAEPTAGRAPLLVEFSDQSEGEISSWHWEFGDGWSSTRQHTSHTYISAGTYAVSLTIEGPGGSDTETKTALIVVLPPEPAPFASMSNLG